MTDHDKEAREAMVTALNDAIQPGEVTAGNLVDAALSADPLRRLLGPRAVEALMRGEAAVVPIWQGSDFGPPACKGYVRIDVERSYGVQAERLDTPSEPA